MGETHHFDTCATASRRRQLDDARRSCRSQPWTRSGWSRRRGSDPRRRPAGRSGDRERCAVRDRALAAVTRDIDVAGEAVRPARGHGARLHRYSTCTSVQARPVATSARAGARGVRRARRYTDDVESPLKMRPARISSSVPVVKAASRGCDHQSISRTRSGYGCRRYAAMFARAEACRAPSRPVSAHCHDDLAPWELARRDRSRSRMVECTVTASVTCWQRGRWKKSSGGRCGARGCVPLRCGTPRAVRTSSCCHSDRGLSAANKAVVAATAFAHEAGSISTVVQNGSRTRSSVRKSGGGALELVLGSLRSARAGRLIASSATRWTTHAAKLTTVHDAGRQEARDPTRTGSRC